MTVHDYGMYFLHPSIKSNDSKILSYKNTKLNYIGI
jgi:hypothetical protein